MQYYVQADDNGSLVMYTDADGKLRACYIDTWTASFVSYSYVIYKGGSWDYLALSENFYDKQEVNEMTSLDGIKDETEYFIDNGKQIANPNYGKTLRQLLEEASEVDLSGYYTKEESDAKFLTSHQDLSGKQDTISDLEEIRQGASLGATALQSLFTTVSTLPTYDEAKEETIYMVKTSDTEEDAYTEYKAFKEEQSDYTFTDGYQVGSVVKYNGSTVGIITSTSDTTAVMMSMAMPTSSGSLANKSDYDYDTYYSYSQAKSAAEGLKVTLPDGVSWRLGEMTELKAVHQNQATINAALAANGGQAVSFGNRYYWGTYNGSSSAYDSSGNYEPEYSQSGGCKTRAFATITMYTPILTWEKFGNSYSKSEIDEMIGDVNIILENIIGE